MVRSHPGIGRQWRTHADCAGGHPASRRPSIDLWGDAILAGAVAHNHPSSIAACAAFTGLLSEALALDRPPKAEWWLDRYCERARRLEGAVTAPCRSRVSRADLAVRRQRSARQFIVELPTLDAATPGSRARFLLETVPSVLYILARHAQTQKEAIVRAVNDTRYNDTVAAIVGAAVGALHGRGALPARWQRNVLGRTGAADDGRVFELISMAQSRFLSQSA